VEIISRGRILSAILYPSERPKNLLDKMRQPYGDYYPISARRVINVQNFYVIIQLTSFRMSEANPKVIESMNLTAEFANDYRNRKDSN
jgi:hypothetical protein